MSRHVIVIGSGIAGLRTALVAREHSKVTLITKAALEESNTRYAQGGIATVFGADDSVEGHVADTLVAGAGLCDVDAVRVLCQEGPARVAELIELGVEFDRRNGELALGREGAHSRARVLHAGGDATGMHIERALVEAVRTAGVSVMENTFLVDLIVVDGAVVGAVLLDGDGRRVELRGDAVVLATGGAGRLYPFTTNPPVATGDGVAAAFRAGAVVRNAEMYQFHPTLLAMPDAPFLVSEAVRGEGAILRNEHGEPFMCDVHEMADLAPRDVVTRAIAEQMELQDGRPVVLDATSLGEAFLAERFPSIDRHCRSLGLRWWEQPVPVTPAGHYWMGGIATDIHGRTTLPGLFAVGEAACSGVHGANRLASNSLLEGLVFGHRAAAALQADGGGVAASPLRVENAIEIQLHNDGTVPHRSDIVSLAWDRAGVLRNGHDLRVEIKQLDQWSINAGNNTAALEDSNLLLIARLVMEGANARTESRGGHYRTDYPASSDAWVRPTDLVIAK